MKQILLLILVICTTACNRGTNERKPGPAEDILSGEYWKQQALNDIMPWWTKYSQDTVSGAFYTTLDSAWNRTGDQNKFPSMVSRHIFSYSCAYLLSGDEEYLRIARNTVRWLIEKAWDNEYGGWFDALDTDGSALQTSKTTFVQVYAITGLAMYYFVTHDTVVLDYIERSNGLLEERVWDSRAGGYFNVMNRDWSISDRNKSFSSMITPVSGYLFYLYLATRNEKYLSQINRILDTTTDRMTDDTSGWVLEDFNEDWKYIPRVPDASEINTGHNIEAAWMLFRNYLLTGNERHLKTGMALSGRISKRNLLNENNIWLAGTGRNDSSLKGSGTYWWIQAYGNMLSLYLYHLTNDKLYIKNFEKGARFWDSGFIDRKQGDTYFSVDSEGNVTDATKATRFKTSYHSIEHCLLNYMYLNLWVNGEEAGLHFMINSSKEGELFFPVPLEDNNVMIKSVSGRADDRLSFTVEGQAVRLHELKEYPLKVVLIKK